MFISLPSVTTTGINLQQVREFTFARHLVPGRSYQENVLLRTLVAAPLKRK